MVLAESVRLDGGTLAVLLLVLAVIGACALGLVALGCGLARAGARGSTGALVAWAGVAVVEALPVPWCLDRIADGQASLFEVLVVAPIPLQALVYAVTRSQAAGSQRS